MKLLNVIIINLLLVSLVVASTSNKQSPEYKATQTAVNLVVGTNSFLQHDQGRICPTCDATNAGTAVSVGASASILAKSIIDKHAECPTLLNMMLSYRPEYKNYSSKVLSIYLDPTIPQKDQMNLNFLDEMEKKKGASFLITEDGFNTFINPKSDNDLIGRLDGQYVAANDRMNELLREGNDDPTQMESLLKIKKGSWPKGTVLYRVDIVDAIDYSPSMPQPWMSGSNENFVHGGVLPSPTTGRTVNECVLLGIPKKKIIVTNIATDTQVYPPLATGGGK